MISYWWHGPRAAGFLQRKGASIKADKSPTEELTCPHRMLLPERIRTAKRVAVPAAAWRQLRGLWREQAERDAATRAAKAIATAAAAEAARAGANKEEAICIDDDLSQNASKQAGAGGATSKSCRDGGMDASEAVWETVDDPTRTATSDDGAVVGRAIGSDTSGMDPNNAGAAASAGEGQADDDVVMMAEVQQAQGQAAGGSQSWEPAEALPTCNPPGMHDYLPSQRVLASGHTHAPTAWGAV